MSAGFLNPWLLGGLFALAVPVLVHLVHRRHTRDLGFPSLMFVRRTAERLRRSRTLRDRGLLALRCLIVVLLVLAFADPFLGTDSAAASSGPHTVLLLDRSYSMSQEARWAQALRLAERRIDGAAPDERLALLAFDQDATLLQDFTADRSRLRTALEGIDTRHRGTDFQFAFTVAARMLSDTGVAGAGIALVSDLQRSGFKWSDGIPLDPALGLELHLVGADPGPNAAVESVTNLGARDDGASLLSVQVRNTGTESLIDAPVRVTVDGRERVVERLTLPPGDRRRMQIEVTTAADRWLPVRIDVAGDRLTSDNEFQWVMPPSRPLSVLLVEDQQTDAAGVSFAEQALVAQDAVELSAVTGAGLTRSLMDAAQVLVMSDPEAVEPGLLRSHLADGGVAVMFVGDHVDTDLVGVGRRVDLAAEPALIGPLAVGHAVRVALGEGASAALARTRVYRYRSVEPRQEDLVLARYRDGAPFLLERRVGAGRLILATTKLDREWSDLGLQAHFVPLLRELVGYLAGMRPVPLSYAVGDVIRLTETGFSGNDTAPASDRKIVVEHPDGARTRLDPETALLRVFQPGLYQVHDPGGGFGPPLFAVNSDRIESRLEALDGPEFRSRIVPIGPSASAPGSPPNPDDTVLWWYLLLLLTLALLLETALSNKRLGSVRGLGPRLEKTQS